MIANQRRWTSFAGDKGRDLSLSSDILKHMAAPNDVRSSVVQGFTIDRESPIPLWFQAAQQFERAIEEGDLPPGTLFENEILLADRMGVSRPTMRRTMEHLVNKGLVVRRRGLGTRVVQPRVRRTLELTSLHDDLSDAGQRPTTVVLSFERLSCEPEVAERLRVDTGDEVVRIERLRAARGTPIAKMTNYLPARVVGFTAEDLMASGLYALLRRAGIHLHSARQTIGARPATSAEAALLGEPRGAALLTMQRETTDDTGSVVEFASHLYAASRYSFEVQLTTP